MSKISILIPIHNRLAITQEGLDLLFTAVSFYQNNGENSLILEVVVIDDGSNDGSSEWIQENYPQVHLLKGDGNLWWSGSINLGIYYENENIESDYILLWNDDTYCEDIYFVNLERILASEKFQNCILASKILWDNSNNLIFNFGCTFNPKTGEKKLIGANETDSLYYSDFIEIDWTGGMGTLIPVEIFKNVGFFDDVNFPQYHGDADFFIRSKKNGFKIYAFPDLVIYNRLNSSGPLHQGNIKKLFKNLVSIRSNYNINKNIKFCIIHSNNPIAYINLVILYLRYFGSFLYGLFKKTDVKSH